MHKIILICLGILFSTNIFAQQSRDTSNISGIEIVVRKLDSTSPPLLRLKLGKKEVLIEKEDLYEIGLYKIQRIDVFERAIQLRKHYAKNGAYIVYPRKEYKKELKKKYLKTVPNTLLRE